MFTTYNNFREIAKLYLGETEDRDLAQNYQANEDPAILAFVFCKHFPFIKTQTNKYFHLTEQEKESFAVEELHRALLDFRQDRGAKFLTFYSRYLNNRLRPETQMLQHQLRKSNYNTESYEAFFEVSQGYKELGYQEIEFLDMLERCVSLTENELKYCKLIMRDTPYVKDSDVAKVLGVTCAAVNYMKKSLEKKLSVVLNYC